ncbi:MAG: serine/threonine protein kinase [Gemmataceae bacterium]|nr:serine/threonine protein kinase [Gemmataceae bacterium]
MRSCHLSLAGFLLGLVPVQAGDWPAFRGPAGDGLAVNEPLPEKIDPAKAKWTTPIEGKGWSSPVVANGKIFLTTAIPSGNANPPDQILTVLCLDALNGKILWSKTVFSLEGAKAPRIHSKNSHASPTPICHKGRVFVHFGHLGTACLDESGEILWKIPGLYSKPVHGNGGSPILVDEKLIFSCDGLDAQKLVALQASTGKVLWSTARDAKPSKPFSFSTPTLIEVNGKKQVISQGSDMVGGYDPESGKEIWRLRYQGYSIIPKPVFSNGLLFFSTGYDKAVLYAIRTDGTGDVTDTHVAYKVERNAPHTPSPLVFGKELYLVADNGVASCLDAATGKVHWQERLAGAYSASPMISQGRIYFQSEEGKSSVARTGTKFELVSTSDFADRTLASYAVADGQLLVRTEKKLLALPLK